MLLPISVQCALPSRTSADMGKWGRWASCCLRNSWFTCSLTMTAWNTVSTWAQQGLVNHRSVNPVQQLGKKLADMASDIQFSPTVCGILSLSIALAWRCWVPWHSAAHLAARETSGEASYSNLQRLNEIYRLHNLGWLDNEIFIMILPLFFEVQKFLVISGLKTMCLRGIHN